MDSLLLAIYSSSFFLRGRVQRHKGILCNFTGAQTGLNAPKIGGRNGLEYTRIPLIKIPLKYGKNAFSHKLARPNPIPLNLREDAKSVVTLGETGRGPR